MRTAHLFAGAGGGLLADLILGHSPVVAVEWDPYACAVLRERFPDTRVIEGDVRFVDFTRELAGIDALCAGFPCQDISAAGKGVGITGERSGLYREVMRAIDAVRPAWVFLENSPRIRTRGRHVVIADLVARGYSWRDGILGAADVGAPHQRDRWWCLATNADQNDSQAGRWLDGRRGEQGAPAAAPGCADLADSTRLGLEVSQPGETGDQQPAAAGTDRSVGWWSAEPPVGRMVDGVAAHALRGFRGGVMRAIAEKAVGEIEAAGIVYRSHQIKCLGNGQVPLCAALAWRLLGGPLPAHPVQHDGRRDGAALEGGSLT